MLVYHLSLAMPAKFGSVKLLHSSCMLCPVCRTLKVTRVLTEVLVAQTLTIVTGLKILPIYIGYYLQVTLFNTWLNRL